MQVSAYTARGTRQIQESDSTLCGPACAQRGVILLGGGRGTSRNWARTRLGGSGKSGGGRATSRKGARTRRRGADWLKRGRRTWSSGLGKSGRGSPESYVAQGCTHAGWKSNHVGERDSLVGEVSAPIPRGTQQVRERESYAAQMGARVGRRRAHIGDRGMHVAQVAVHRWRGKGKVVDGDGHAAQARGHTGRRGGHVEGREAHLLQVHVHMPWWTGQLGTERVTSRRSVRAYHSELSKLNARKATSRT